MQDSNSKRRIFTHCQLSARRNGGRPYRKENDLLASTMPLSQLNLDIQVDLSGLLYNETQS
jgi:hypothetical protein